MNLNLFNNLSKLKLKQIAFKLKYKFHDLSVNFKLFNENNEIIIQKIISNQAGQSGLICIEKLDQNLLIEFDSCHLLKPNSQNINELASNVYQIDLKNLNPKLIEFKSFQHSLKIEVKTNLDESLKEEDLTNDHKEIQVHVYEIIGQTSVSEEEITKDIEPITNILNSHR